MEALQPGDPARVSSYELLGRLGAGGMGVVYLARSAGGRKVAVKVIRPELISDPEFRTRFRREVVAMKAVSGFFTAPVVDADPDGSPAWLATAYVPGPSLAEAVRDRGPMPQGDVLVLAAGLAEALAAIHREGLTHRDLKPANVLLADDGPRVIDFGLAVTAQSSVVTQAGVVVGTPSYMSPEQIHGQGVGPSSDVFSLGSVLVHAATGRAPYGEGGTMELMYRVVNNEPDLSGISGTLLHLVSACLNKNPAQRPAPGRILEVLAEGAGVQATAAIGWVPPQLAQHENSGPQPTGPSVMPHNGGNSGNNSGSAGAITTPHAPYNPYNPYAIHGMQAQGAPAPKKNRMAAYAVGGSAAVVALAVGIAIAASGGGSPSPIVTGAPTSSSSPAANVPTNYDVHTLFTAADASTYLKAAETDLNDNPQDDVDTSSSLATAHSWDVKVTDTTDATFLNSILVQTLTEKTPTGVADAAADYASNISPLPGDPPFTAIQLAGADKAAIQVIADTDLASDSLQRGKLEILKGDVEVDISFEEMSVSTAVCQADLNKIAVLVAGRMK